jgi:hypothetical protein
MEYLFILFQSLLNAGAALYVENRDKLTPCELGKIEFNRRK